MILVGVISLSEITQREKVKYSVISLFCRILKENKYILKIDLQI